MINDINKSKLIAYGLPIIAYFVIFFKFFKLTHPPLHYKLIDFDCFYLVGKLFWLGKLNDAYDMRAFIQHYLDLYATSSFMPWTYPPQFNLVTALLAKFSRPIAFVMFTAGSFTLYLLVLKRTADRYFSLLITLMFPCILLNAFTGQNGFLTAFLIGVFFYLYHHQRDQSGYILGLLVIKPHFALGIGLLVLMDRRWGVVVRALLVALLSSIFCTIVFGADIWQAFFLSLHQSKYFLDLGIYPMERMVSAYAMLKRMGVSSRWALGLHMIEAIIIVYSLFKVHRNIKDQKMRSAIFILGSLFISPYLYDYDLALMALVIGFSLHVVLAFSSDSQRLWLFASVFMVTSWKLILFIIERIAILAGYEEFEHPVTFGNLFLLAIFFILMQIAATSIKGKLIPVNS